MTEFDPQAPISELWRRWRAVSLLGHLAMAAALAAPLLALAHRLAGPAYPWLALAGAGLWIGVAVWQVRRSGWSKAGPADMAAYLNRRYPQLEDSADLLLDRPDHLSPLARRQRDRVAARLAGLKPRLPDPFERRSPWLIASAAVTSLILFQPFGPMGGVPDIRTVTSAGGNALASDTVPQAPRPPALSGQSLWVMPPAYTRLGAFRGEGETVGVPAGSRVRWLPEFSGPIEAGGVLLADGTGIPLRQGRDGNYAAEKVMARTTLYRYDWRSGAGAASQSGYFGLEVRPDRPPEIEVAGLAPFAEYVFVPGKEVPFTVRVTDDFGVSDALMVATLSRGSGESVQFREDTLRFAATFRDQKSRYELRHTLALDKLGMGEGDELYLHIEALDNRSPDPQRTKTAKFILAFAKEEANVADMASGLPVNRLPEYFRSQRQIIIDTEKLIARRKDLEPEVVQAESNNIAIDQKLLRLRYGQFLGEEYQTVIGAAPPGQGEAAADHDHDHDHDHAGEPHSGEEPVREADHDHDHDHDPAPTTRRDPSEDEEIAELEPYYHTHDMSAEATFFDAATKSKLRAALANMWDAELHLRMGRPEKALPFEYEALKRIKEIQQASRVYVQRVGFEPPVINVAEERLTGEQDDILSPRRNKELEPDARYPDIEAAGPVLERLLREDRLPTPREKVQLQAAGDALAGLALEKAGAYLDALGLLREIMEGDRPEHRETALRRLQAVFHQLQPEAERRPLRAEGGPGALYELYLKELQRSR